MDPGLASSSRSSSTDAGESGNLAAESLFSGPSPLTERETDVLRAAATGGTVADIAKTLHLSAGTVRNHLSSAIGKTQARTRAEAARLAETNGWL